MTLTHPGLAAHPDLGAFIPVASPGVHAWVRRGYESALPQLGLTVMPKGEFSVSGGRAAHPVVMLEGGERIVVRGYRRGGLMRHFNRERYFLGHRALDELRATEHARLGGVRVPEPIAAIERSAGPGYTAALATRWIGGGIELSRYAFAGGADRVAVLREAGRQIALMHEAGVGHPDLNLHNLLIVPGDGVGATVYLLDFDGARVTSAPVPGARRSRDLLRMRRSARKLNAPLGPAEWRAFRQGYGPAWPLPDSLG